MPLELGWRTGGVRSTRVRTALEVKLDHWLLFRHPHRPLLLDILAFRFYPSDSRLENNSLKTWATKGQIYSLINNTPRPPTVKHGVIKAYPCSLILPSVFSLSHLIMSRQWRITRHRRRTFNMGDLFQHKTKQKLEGNIMQEEENLQKKK